VESNACDIASMTFEDENRSWVAPFDVEELYSMMASGSEEPLVR
jgi:hypothetical protein